MKEQSNTKGYYLHIMALNQWVYDDGSGQVFDGTFQSVKAHMLRMKFELIDILEGLEMLAENPDHDAVHFGTYKSPMFTLKRKESKVA